jgi:hypothetical protein
MFCFWCVWGRPNINDQQANVSNVSAAEAAELDQLTANQSVNLSTCQPKATPPVNYKVGSFLKHFALILMKSTHHKGR